MTNMSSRSHLSMWERDFWDGLVRSFAFVTYFSYPFHSEMGDVDLEGPFVTRQAVPERTSFLVKAQQPELSGVYL
jgi:hypothetical protein